MERDEGARLIGWTMGPGCLAGAVVAVLAAASVSASGGGWWPSVGMIALAAVVGVFAGALTGFVIGVPVALVTSVVRRRTEHWRGVGTALTGAGTVVAGAAPLGPPSLYVLMVAVLGMGCAWWGLGRIFDPPAARRWATTPSARRES